MGDPGEWPSLKILNLIGQTGFIIALSTSSSIIVFSTIFQCLPDIQLVGIVFTITMGCYTLDRLIEAIKNPNRRTRNNINVQSQYLIILFIIVLLIVGILLAFSKSMFFGILILIAPVIVFIYSGGPKNIVIPIKNLLYLKDIIIALGWTALILIVLIYYNLPLTFIVVLFSIAIFGKFYVMAALYDFKDVESDLRNDIHTLPNTLGEAKTKKILHLINSLATVWILILIYFEFIPKIGFIFFPAWVYQTILIMGVGIKAPLWFYYLPCDLEQVFWVLFVLLLVMA